jgi:DNA-binding transcriptional ArsR family regulator
LGRLAGASVTAGKLAPADERLLQVLTRAPESWMSAAQVAKACGKTWYTVSFSLRRLTERGLVEEDVISRRGTARSVEHTRVYRVRPLAGESRRVSTLPAWLAPQAVVAIGFSTMVEGVAAIRDERRDRRDPERPAPRLHPNRRFTDEPKLAAFALRAARLLWARLEREAKKNARRGIAAKAG